MKHRPSAVEVVIFAVVSLVFVNSLYGLFTNNTPEHPLRSPASTQSVATDGTNVDSGRIVGGIPNLLPYETRCQSDGEFLETQAAKIRVTGPLCGYDDEDPITDSQILNTTTKYSATVFADATSKKFSTDFIPLDQGKNNITLEFKHQSGRKNEVTISVQRK